MDRRPLLILDPLRFACAAMVVAHHFGAMLPIVAPSFLRYAVAGLNLGAGRVGWAWPGWIGVELFFVISGYVIALSLGADGAWAFLRRRALRLLPAAWLCASVTLLVTAAFRTVDPVVLTASWARALLLLPGQPLIDGSYWTLRAEISFYALAAIMLMRAREPAEAVRRLATLLGGASAIYWGAALVTGVSLPTGALAWTLLPHGCFFALGLLLAQRRAGSPARMWLTVPIGFACFAEIVAHTHELAEGFTLPDRPTWPLVLFIAGVSVIVWGERWQAPLARFGAGRLRWLGLLTYPLYLLHQHVGEAVIVVLRHRGVGWTAAQLLSALTMVGAAAIVVQVEPMIRRAILASFDRLARGRRHMFAG